MCYVENTHFDKIGTVYKNYNSSDGGTIALTFSGCLNGVGNVGTVSPSTYSYSVLPVADVKKYLADTTCGAGATLAVTTDGVISTPCGSVDVNNPAVASDIKLYPSIVGDYLNIDFPDTKNESARISIYALNGKKMFSDSGSITADNKTKLNLSNFPGGIYFCNIPMGHCSITRKIIKR